MNGGRHPTTKSFLFGFDLIVNEKLKEAQLDDEWKLVWEVYKNERPLNLPKPTSHSWTNLKGEIAVEQQTCTFNHVTLNMMKRLKQYFALSLFLEICNNEKLSSVSAVSCFKIAGHLAGNDY